MIRPSVLLARARETLFGLREQHIRLAKEHQKYGTTKTRDARAEVRGMIRAWGKIAIWLEDEAARGEE